MTIATDHRRSAGAAAADSASLPPMPEPGQVVNIRGSTWALEEDRLGQELAVVWELEVVHTVVFALTPADAEAGMVQP